MTHLVTEFFLGCMACGTVLLKSHTFIHTYLIILAQLLNYHVAIASTINSRCLTSFVFEKDLFDDASNPSNFLNPRWASSLKIILFEKSVSIIQLTAKYRCEIIFMAYLFTFKIYFKTFLRLSFFFYISYLPRKSVDDVDFHLVSQHTTYAIQ